MKNKNKIQEVTLSGGKTKKPTIIVPNSQLTKTLGKLQGTDANIMPVDDSLLGEVDAVIEPKDPETIKYLSNVIDNNTGEVSKPFVIGDKQYKMVRGLNQNDEIVLGVFCFDDMDADGNNMIHPVDYFEENVAMPAMMSEKMTMNENDESIGLSEYKHFIVNEKTNKFRKFKTLPELAMASMNEEEKYMTLKEFKKYFEGKIFGGNKRKINEQPPQPQTGEMEQPQQPQQNIKADVERLSLALEKSRPITNKIRLINSPIEKSQILVKFAGMIGLDLNLFARTVKQLKQQATQQAQPIQETRKIIKVKNIK
jgi:hypothetical protein